MSSWLLQPEWMRSRPVLPAEQAVQQGCGLGGQAQAWWSIRRPGQLL